MKVLIQSKEIDEYKNDGVVCLRNAISDHTLESAHNGIKKNLAEPNHFFRDYTEEGSTGRYVFEFWNWWRIQEFRKIAFDQDIGNIVADLIGAKKLFLLMDQWFFRDEGSTNAAIWHQDEPYFDFFEGQKCVVWFPLESTLKIDGLTFIKGSHRWNKLFMAQNFETRKPFAGQTEEYYSISDFNDFSESYISWDMEPGDCLVFDFRVIHRTTSFADCSTKPMSRISYRYGDQDVVFRRRGVWTEELSKFLIDSGQIENQTLDCEYLPKIVER